MTLDADSKKTMWRRRLGLFVLVTLVWIAMELGFPAFLRLVHRALEH